jgi:hypothetical protein
MATIRGRSKAVKILATLKEKLTPDKEIVLKLIDLVYVVIGMIGLLAVMSLAYHWGTLAR